MNKHILRISSTGLLAMALTVTSCEDFLDRPVEDKASNNEYFQNATECLNSVNTLYSTPWNDFIKDGNFWFIGDFLAGNYSADFAKNEFYNHTISSGNAPLNEACRSIWDVIGHANVTIDYLKNAPVAESVKNQCIGEAMVMKSMAYFYLVRIWGAVPIIHNTNELIENHASYDLYRYKECDVYEYIINTLKHAMTLLPKKDGTDGRIDYYSAEGLLAKVYLQSAASKDGKLDAKLLEKAKEHAWDVIENSGRELQSDYYDIYRISTGSKTPEALITLHWAISSNWCDNNIAMCVFGAKDFFQSGQGWGEWNGPSVDLMELFGVDPLDPATINATAYAYVEDAQNVTDGKYTVKYHDDVDVRRQATMSMLGDYYKYWFRDKGGFLNNCNNVSNVASDWNADKKEAPIFKSDTGAQLCKMLQGNTNDHNAESGSYYGISGMCSATPTHLLRLSDVYLVYAEACMNVATAGDARSTSDATAIECYNKVRARAHAKPLEDGTLTFTELMNERRRELAMEGDNWFDYVRQADYDSEGAADRIKAQDRNAYGEENLKAVYGIGTKRKTADEVREGRGTSNKIQNIVHDANGKMFRITFLADDMAANPNLAKDPVDYDFVANKVDYYDPDNFRNL